MKNILYKKQMHIIYNAYDYNLLYEGEHLNGKGKVYDYKDDLL